ncbi:MAG: YVTN family beta-propeller protein [Paraglaciecola sp.]|jgi:YVTN family beta-propeller protein
MMNSHFINTFTLALIVMGRAHLAKAEPIIYVANALSENESVIDAASNTVIKSILTGGQPVGVAFHPTLPIAYVNDRAEPQVFVIDTDTHSVLTTIPLSGDHPDAGVEFSHDGTRAYVTNACGSDLLSAIDTATHT